MCRWSYGLVLLGAASLISCAQPERVNYADVAAQKEHLLIERERVEYTPRDVSPDCDSLGCTFSVEDANILLEDTERMEALIDQLNNEAESLESAHNSLVRALIECSYGSAQRDATIAYQEDLAFKEQIMAAGKQLILVGACGILLW